MCRARAPQGAAKSASDETVTRLEAELAPLRARVPQLEQELQEAKALTAVQPCPRPSPHPHSSRPLIPTLRRMRLALQTLRGKLSETVNAALVLRTRRAESVKVSRGSAHTQSPRHMTLDKARAKGH